MKSEAIDALEVSLASLAVQIRLFSGIGKSLSSRGGLRLVSTVQCGQGSGSMSRAFEMMIECPLAGEATIAVNALIALGVVGMVLVLGVCGDATEELAMLITIAVTCDSLVTFALRSRRKLLLTKWARVMLVQLMRFATILVGALLVAGRTDISWLRRRLYLETSISLLAGV